MKKIVELTKMSHLVSVVYRTCQELEGAYGPKLHMVTSLEQALDKTCSALPSPEAEDRVMKYALKLLDTGAIAGVGGSEHQTIVLLRRDVLIPKPKAMHLSCDTCWYQDSAKKCACPASTEFGEDCCVGAVFGVCVEYVCNVRQLPTLPELDIRVKYRAALDLIANSGYGGCPDLSDCEKCCGTPATQILEDNGRDVRAVIEGCRSQYDLNTGAGGVLDDRYHTKRQKEWDKWFCERVGGFKGVSKND